MLSPPSRIAEHPAWVQRLRTDDMSVMDELFVTYFVPLTGFAMALVKQQDAAEDLAQDALATLWMRRASLAESTSITKYLFTSVRNASLNRIRGERVRTAWRQAHRDIDHGPQSYELAPPDVQLEHAERVSWLQHAIDALPDRYRHVLALRAHGLDYDAAAEVLGVPVKTVRNRAAEGVHILRKKLAKIF